MAALMDELKFRALFDVTGFDKMVEQICPAIASGKQITSGLKAVDINTKLCSVDQLVPHVINGTTCKAQFVEFYKPSKNVDLDANDFGAFSNFAPFPVKFLIPGGHFACFATAEHAYQTLKFDQTMDVSDPYKELTQRELQLSAYAMQITTAPTAQLASVLGHTQRLSETERDAWLLARNRMMMLVVYTKFKQHPDLAKLLLKTKDLPIIYTAPNNYWGWGPKHDGENMLGKTLMAVRTMISKDGI